MMTAAEGSLKESRDFSRQSSIHRSDNWSVLVPLRGIAVLWVLTFHAQLSPSFQHTFPGIYQVTRSGFLGVSMFFVISGFCLGAAGARSLSKSESPLVFIRRRFRRIYPPFWFSILFVVSLPYLKRVAFSFVGQPINSELPLFTHFGWWDWFCSATLLQAFRFGNLPLHEKFNSLNVVYWSLAIEVQFYLVICLGIALKAWYYRMLIALTVASAVFATGIVSSSILNSGCFLPYWSMFAWGLLIYECRQRNWTLCRYFASSHAKWIALSLFSVLIGWTGFRLAHRNAFSEQELAAITAIALWLALPLEHFWTNLRPANQILITRVFAPLSFLGMMSYSIYLIHFNLHKLPRLTLDRLLDTNSVVYDIVLLFLTCALCYPFYFLCERPFASSRDPMRSKTKAYAPNNAVGLSELA